jgi:hypothetical protein
MEPFNRDEFEMPEQIPQESEKTDEDKEEEHRKEIEKQVGVELKLENEFILHLDTISHSAEFPGEVVFTEKLSEFHSANKNNPNVLLDYKIYKTSIEKLLQNTDTALTEAIAKLPTIEKDTFSFKKTVEDKIDEIAERKMMISRQLYYLNQIKFD